MASIQDTIGNYRLLEELASGSFGRVYRGAHTILTNRIVAIKLMHGVLLNSQKERDSFIQEALLLERLKHPHILPIIDVGFHEGFPYMVTEYAPNGSLRDRLRRQTGKPLPEQEALSILTQIGEALHHAHEQHIIHRDLKPENILFNARGEIVLADFGIATVLGTLTIQQATIIGTPPYMAPEQFKGLVGRESDQYALGCIAYELFTGRQPFTAPDFFSMAFKHMQEIPTAPRQLNADLPTHIEQAVLKAMAKERTDRYASVLTFTVAIETRPKRNEGRYLRLDVAQLTDVGRELEHNEDNFAYVIPKYVQVMARKGALFVVADGSERHAAGEVASEIAVDTIPNVYYQDGSDDVAISLLHAMKRANALIYQRATENIFRRGMRTTSVATVLCGNMAYIANVGNSRAYLIRKHQTKSLSKDHSWVAEQVRAGLMSEDQARIHPQGDISTRYLGAQVDVNIDLFQEHLEENDYLVLCTDGLHRLVSEYEILRIVESSRPQESIYHLVERANENGGFDNITAIVIYISEIGSESLPQRAVRVGG